MAEQSIGEITTPGQAGSVRMSEAVSSGRVERAKKLLAWLKKNFGDLTTADTLDIAMAVADWAADQITAGEPGTNGRYTVLLNQFTMWRLEPMQFAIDFSSVRSTVEALEHDRK